MPQFPPFKVGVVSAHLIGLPEGEARVNIREGLRRAPGTWLISIRLSAIILPLGGCPCVRGSTIFQTGSLCNAGQEFIKASSPEAQVSLNQGRPTLQLLQEGDTLGDLSIQRGLWAVEALLLEPTLGWAPECMLTLAMASSSHYPQGARSYPGRLHTVCPSSASAAFGLGKASAPHGGSVYSPVNPRLQTLCFRVSDALGSSLSLPVPIRPPAVYPSPAARAVCVAHESEHSARCWNPGKKYNPDTSLSLQRAPVRPLWPKPLSLQPQSATFGSSNFLGSVLPPGLGPGGTLHLDSASPSSSDPSDLAQTSPPQRSPPRSPDPKDPTPARFLSLHSVNLPHSEVTSPRP